MQVVDLADITITPDVLGDGHRADGADVSRSSRSSFDDNTLTVAMCDPQNLRVQDELRTFLGFNIRVVVTTESTMNAALERYYGESTTASRASSRHWRTTPSWPRRPPASARTGRSISTTSTALADSAPVRKLLNMVLLLAIKDHASDMHFEPFEDEFKIRIKADGVLYEMVPPPRHLAFAITTRIKVMANLDIAERRLPQDGRIELTVGGHPVDLRVSVLPTMFGESVVMRVLDRSVDVARPEQGRHGRRDAQAVPRGHPQAQRHRAGHRARPAPARRPRSIRRSTS